MALGSSTSTRLGPLDQAREVVFWGADSGPGMVGEQTVTEQFARSMSLADALEPLIASGVACDVRKLRPEWDARIAKVLKEATLELPKPRRATVGGRKGHHSEHLGHLLTEMQFLQRAYPDAKW